MSKIASTKFGQALKKHNWILALNAARAKENDKSFLTQAMIYCISKNVSNDKLCEYLGSRCDGFTNHSSCQNRPPVIYAAARNAWNYVEMILQAAKDEGRVVRCDLWIDLFCHARKNCPRYEEIFKSTFPEIGPEFLYRDAYDYIHDMYFDRSMTAERLSYMGWMHVLSMQKLAFEDYGEQAHFELHKLRVYLHIISSDEISAEVLDEILGTQFRFGLSHDEFLTSALNRTSMASIVFEKERLSVPYQCIYNVKVPLEKGSLKEFFEKMAWSSLVREFHYFDNVDDTQIQFMGKKPVFMLTPPREFFDVRAKLNRVDSDHPQADEKTVGELCKVDSERIQAQYDYLKHEPLTGLNLLIINKQLDDLKETLGQISTREGKDLPEEMLDGIRQILISSQITNAELTRIHNPKARRHEKEFESDGTRMNIARYNKITMHELLNECAEPEAKEDLIKKRKQEMNKRKRERKKRQKMRKRLEMENGMQAMNVVDTVKKTSSGNVETPNDDDDDDDENESDEETPNDTRQKTLASLTPLMNEIKNSVYGDDQSEGSALFFQTKMIEVESLIDSLSNDDQMKQLTQLATFGNKAIEKNLVKSIFIHRVFMKFPRFIETSDGKLFAFDGFMSHIDEAMKSKKYDAATELSYLASRLFQSDKEKQLAFGLLQAKACRKSKRFSTGLEVIQKCLESDSTCAEAYFEMGMCHMLNKEGQKAKKAFERCLEIDPSHKNAIVALKKFRH
eukprot:TRINITY_DN15269_c0_g1_i1.p1 TRINITY_DN15269_c0_g1~~TRINITY_DN15269_c0_g1_i1.p1  ORF type:complete len:736 (-),score=200.23 TRINITY_DN15269_c0_g1_i1:1251-3458(-)